MHTAITSRLADNTTLARLYVALVLPMLVALNFVLPAFHGGDDYDHAKRAHSAAHFQLWPQNAPGLASGGMIDTGLAAFIEQQKPIIFLRRDTALAPPDALPGWTGRQVYAEFPSAAYLPLIYLPQMAALRLAEVLDLPIPHAILLARLANSAAAVALAAWALALLPFNGSVVLLILLLPKSLVQFASHSLDPLFHSTTIALLAFACRAVIGGSVVRRQDYLLASLAILTVAGARPSMAILALPLVWLAWRDRDRIALAALLAAPLAAAAWFLIVLPLTVDPRCASGAALGDRILHFILNGAPLLADTLARHGLYYAASFIGELGWGHAATGSLNHVLSPWIYVGAAVMMTFALAQTISTPCSMPAPWRGLLLACGIGMAVAIFFLLYLGCTPLDATVIGGVQGRYLVTPVILISTALAGLASPMESLPRVILPALVLFALAGFGALIADGLYLYWNG